MALAIVHTRACIGVDAPLVTVEAHISSGLPSLSVVGLPEAAVRESRDRVRSAIINSGFEFPRRRITVNLAPADLPKEGGRFDLPVALAILAASEQVEQRLLTSHEFSGELALSGELRPVRGLLPAAIQAARSQRNTFLPLENADEASRVPDARVYAAESLTDVCRQLAQASQPYSAAAPVDVPTSPVYPDLADVNGQPAAKRALEIAAAGGHHLLLSGPPGAGKTMLANCLPGILPALAPEEAIETASIYSITGMTRNPEQWQTRPFRAPHHSASATALVGGGSKPAPGEISLAHQGVLFLDELPEFQRPALETLREPLETGEILISRAAGKTRFPARFQLIAAMNPCPCGNAGVTEHGNPCRCTPDQIRRYRMRVSGPLLDRIDLRLQVPAVKPRELMPARAPAEPSETVKARVEAARDLQLQRAGQLNAALPPNQLQTVLGLTESDLEYLYVALERTGQSARAAHRIQRVARTIGDLDHSRQVQRKHLAEAMAFRGNPQS